MRLLTPTGRGAFSVKVIDERGVVLLLGAGEAPTRFSWECLEGVGAYLHGRGWTEIGSTYDTSARTGTLDEYLKQYVNRATAGWVAVVLEHAGVIEIDRRRPACVRLLAPPT